VKIGDIVVFNVEEPVSIGWKGDVILLGKFMRYGRKMEE
jgi:hypothetical protein